MKHKAIIMIIGTLCSLLLAEQVCKIRYKGTPEELHNSTLTVSDQAVALSEYITVSSPKDSITSGTNSSVYFVIDHSGSMYSGFKENKPNDQWGSRFTVTSDLIDTIFNKNPNTEVGLVFFRRVPYMTSFDERELMVDIDPVNPYNGSYLKLLQLNKEYTSQALGTATGYEILKHYLRTKKKSFGSSEYTDLEYKPSIANIGESQFNSGTNISIGFEAAKMGFKDAQYDKDNHYIIFFSDGEATEPSADSTKMMEYIDGKDVPTTFTVFFTPDNSALANLKTMTENIKNNGYSSSNSQSQLHTIETDHAKLMKLLMDNAIGTILEQVNTNIPIELKVGTGNQQMDWDGKGFSFNKLFPLTGTETDFSYTIKYQVKKDTVTRSGRAEFDTVQSDVQFTVKTEQGYTMPDTVEALYWERSISFYYNGSEISNIEPHMDEIEVRFTSTEIDTHYTYENVKITLTTTEGSSQDEEILNLSDKGGFHSATVKRTIGDPAKGDGVLQHRNPDELVAQFKNPELPLDTLRTTIAVNGQDELTVTGGTYFDTDADGKVDSIFLNVSPDARLEPVAGAIADAVELPGSRKFNVKSSSYKSGGISFQVEEDRSERETGIIANEDVMTVTAIDLGETAALLASEFTFSDGMAPVIVAASVIDSAKAGAKDLLTVTFSEEVTKVDASKPLRFYSMSEAKEFEATLAVESQNGSEVIYAIKSFDDGFSLNNGDSLRIKHDASPIISDGHGNSQTNDKNRREEIRLSIVKEGITITSGTYFDTNADGQVDSVFLAVSPASRIESTADALIDLVSLPGYRQFTIERTGHNDKGIFFVVQEDRSERETFVVDEEVLTIEEQKLSDEVLLNACSFKYEDGMAPVVTGASLIDSAKAGAKDLLTVLFSEPVTGVDADTPLRFYSVSKEDEHDPQLAVEEKNGSEIIFNIESVDGGFSVIDGDSLKIHSSASPVISDSHGNAQENWNNRREVISVTVIEEGIRMTGGAYFDRNADGKIDSIYVDFDGAHIEQNIDALFDAVELPEFRRFNVDSHRYQDGGLAIEVWQDISDAEINTAVAAEDELVISDQIVTDSDMKILQGTVAIEDRVAPVIVTAHFVDSIFQVFTGEEMNIPDSGTDLLTVTFSETVDDISEMKPFTFWSRQNDNTFEAVLELVDLRGSEATFGVVELYDVESIKERDSIRIREGIADLEGNVQENRDNVRREISVEEIVDVSWKADEVNLVLKTTIFDPGEEIEFDRAYAGIEKAGIYQGAMVLIVEPENRDEADLNERDILTGKLSLVDYLGNTIFRGETMEYDEENRRLIYVWDGKNRSGRTVGSGAYSLVVEFERSFYTKGLDDDPELVGGTQVITTSVGVRQ